MSREDMLWELDQAMVRLMYGHRSLAMSNYDIPELFIPPVLNSLYRPVEPLKVSGRELLRKYKLAKP